jgi:pimeloyl-ACP methyl ester carboxylesterase
VPVLLPPPPNRPIEEHLRERWSGHGAPGFAQQHPEAIDEIVAALLERPTPRAGVLQQARAISAWCGGHRLRRITAPTSVVHGELDRFIFTGNGARLAGLIPNARYVALPDVGHLVPTRRATSFSTSYRSSTRS